MSAGDIRLRGTDITLTGAKLDATDTLNLSARNDLTITAAKSSHTADFEVISGSMGNRTRGGTEEAGSRMAHVSGEWQQALGSELNAGGNLTLNAGRDVTFTGSSQRRRQHPRAGRRRYQHRGRKHHQHHTPERQQPYVIRQQRPPGRAADIKHARRRPWRHRWRATACWPKVCRLTAKRGVLASARRT